MGFRSMQEVSGYAFDEAISMTCTAEKDAMSCVSSDVTVDFTRAE